MCLAGSAAPIGGQTLQSKRATSIAPAPIPPETITRAADGSVTVRAFRVSGPVEVDGRLDEEFYRTTPPFGGFIQQDPVEGAPATEQTDAWIFFDDDTLYVAARCWDSHPEREIVNEMRRDSNSIIQNEGITISFDTFNDKRNSVFFQTNALGAQRDAAITDESSQNTDWNTVWDVRTQRSDRGWTVEFAIPFKSLRYDSSPQQVWGFNMRRTIRWKNEWAYLTPMPAYMSQRAIWLVSLGATLVGIETPSKSLNLELKPYSIGGLRTDLRASPSFRNKLDRNAGVDLKYGLSKSLTLDLTYRTDFAQVEDDTQQVNLTRFNQFFPERREFFLEGVGIFAFGGTGTGGGGNTPIMFFSRRIGLNNSRQVPIVGGGRVTGRVGDYSIGVLNIQSARDDESGSRATNFSVVRVKRDILRRSNVGVLYTQRNETEAAGRPAGHTLGVDGSFSLSPNLFMTGYLARTDAHGVTDRNTSYMARFDYNNDRYGLFAERLAVAERFNPEVGFLRRSDFLRNFGSVRFSPRPARGRLPWVRRFVYYGSLEYLENTAGRLDFRDQEASFEVEMQNSDLAGATYRRNYEFIPFVPGRPFEISPGIVVPVGGYDYGNLSVYYSFGTQHRLSGTASYQQGTLYGGTKRTVRFGGGRMEITPQFALEPSVETNSVALPWGRFNTTLMTERTTYTITPRMYVSALTQYSSSSRTFSTNARFRWEYQPGSEMFVVYSDGRDTQTAGFPRAFNRAFIVKVNRLFRL